MAGFNVLEVDSVTNAKKLIAETLKTIAELDYMKSVEQLHAAIAVLQVAAQQSKNNCCHQIVRNSLCCRCGRHIIAVVVDEVTVPDIMLHQIKKSRQ